MNTKRMIVFGLIMALIIWALSEMFVWIIGDIIGAVKLARIAPALAGFIIGLFQAAMVQMIRRKRQEMLGEQPQENK